jgi:hypothetical protein
MDLNNLRGLMEAFEQVHAPQEVDEAVKGEPSERRKDLAAERRAGHRPLPAKEGEKYASHKLSQIAYAKRKRMGEELDIFDVVLEFLQAEGFAETLEEAEWMMANMIDEEAIDIIHELDENRRMARDPEGRKSGHSKQPDPSKPGFTGTGNMSIDQIRKMSARIEKDKKEEFEAWFDEAMTNYEKNRKRAAQRAAARNAARDQGKTGAVPGVGYVTPRRERETWTDESGKTRHAKGL